MDEKPWMPKYLLSSRQISSFEMEEFIVFVGGIVAFIILKNKYWIFFAFIGCWAVIRLKEKFPKGILFNWAYRCGLLDLEGYPPGLSKDFIE